MLSFAAPWWLLALLLVGVVWCLHRFRERGRVFPVAALFLWSDSQGAGHGASLAARAHPLWWLRGLVVGLIVLGLCEPRRDAGTVRPVTVWVDDSLSMYSRDAGGESRLQRALAQLQEQLATAPAAAITLRSLGVPGRALVWDASAGAAMAARLREWGAVAGAEPAPPLAAAMALDSEHWLLSDGVSDIAAWVEVAPLAKLLMVGSETENVAVSRLVVSATSADATAREVLVSVRNGGARAAQRRLDLRSGEAVLGTLQLSLAPAEEVQRVLTVSTRELAANAPLRVSLSPADALALDDELEIAAAQLQLALVRVSPACGPHLRAALNANPLLSVSRDSALPVALVVVCEPDPAPRQGPAIVVRAGPGTAALGAEPYWHTATASLQELALAPAALRGAGAHLPAAAGVRVLSAGSETLISHDAARAVIDVRMDLAAPALVQSPEYPLLVSALVDLALGLDSGSGVLAAARNPAPAVIAPRQLVLTGVPVAGTGIGSGRDISHYPIAVALGLLCLDCLLLLLRRRQQSRQLRQWRFRHAP